MPPENLYDSAHRPHPLAEELLALARYRDLIRQFVARSIKTRYKRSVLGVVWTMLNPLLTMIVLTLVFSNFFRITLPNYPVYVLSGLVAWNFFSNASREAMGEMIWSGSLLNRIYVPRSVFAVSAAGSGLVNLVLSLAPLLLIGLVIGAPFTPALLVVPAAVILLALFTLGVGLLLATAAVYFADILPVYDVLLTIWLYATPIIYPFEMIPAQWAWLFRLNPMYIFLDLFRTPIYQGVVPPLENWLAGAGIALVVFLAGGLVFTSRSNDYAYRL